MDRAIEEAFVNNFVTKEKRERILYELASAKKRKAALWRLYEALDRRLAVFEKRDAHEDELIAEVEKYSKDNGTCYVIANSKDDGKTLPLGEAVKNMLEYESNCVIVCGENTILASDEYEICGTPAKMILHKSK